MFAHGRARRGCLAHHAQLTRSGSSARLLRAASVVCKIGCCCCCCAARVWHESASVRLGCAGAGRPQEAAAAFEAAGDALAAVRATLAADPDKGHAAAAALARRLGSPAAAAAAAPHCQAAGDHAVRKLPAVPGPASTARRLPAPTARQRAQAPCPCCPSRFTGASPATVRRRLLAVNNVLSLNT